MLRRSQRLKSLEGKERLSYSYDKKRKIHQVISAEKGLGVEKYSASPRFIPRDIIFNILVFVPAKFLHNKMRYVCKEWNEIISDPMFIRAHLVCSSLLSPGVVLQNEDEPQRAYYTETSGGPNEVSIREIPFAATILDSCDGLLLVLDKTNPRVLRVVNLITKRKWSLPPLTAGVRVLDKPHGALAFAPCSGQYKVFVSCIACGVSDDDGTESEGDVELLVCTLAIDRTWRSIDRSSMTSSEDALMFPPICRAGFVYWYPCRQQFGLALDVDAETMYEFRGPQGLVIETLKVTYTIGTRTSLGLITGIDFDELTVWELAEPKSGTWVRSSGDLDGHVMFHRIDLLYQLEIGSLLRSCRHLPILEHGNLLFSAKSGDEGKFDLVCYNMETGYTWSHLLQWPTELDQLAHFHVNSLLSLNNPIL